MSSGHMHTKEKRNPIIILFLLFLITLSFTGCVESYDDVLGEVKDSYEEQGNRTIRVEVMKLFGNYSDSWSGRSLEPGETITIQYDPLEYDFPNVTKGDYIKFDIHRGSWNTHDPDEPFKVTKMEVIGHPFYGIYLFLIGFSLLIGIGVVFLIWYSGLDKNDREEKFTNSFFGSVECPRCDEDAEIEIRARKFIPTEVRMLARCDECEYDLLLPSWHHGNYLWGRSKGYIKDTLMLCGFLALVVLVLGTFVIFLGLLNVMDSLEIYHETLGSLILLLVSLVVSILIVGVLHTVMKNNLICYLNERAITGAIGRMLREGNGPHV